MYYFLLVYLFLIPLEYIQMRIPMGPTGINYGTLSMLAFTVWLLVARPKAKDFRFTPAALNKVLIAYYISIFFGMTIAFAQFPDNPFMNPFDPDAFAFKRLTYIYTEFLMFWVCANMLDSRRKIRWALIAMAAASPLVVRAFHSDLTGVSAWHYSDEMRVAGPFRSIGSNELGAFFVFSAVMMLMNGISTRDLKERLLYLGGGCGYVYGILYSYSRATQLAFGASIALIACIRHRWVLILMVFAFMTSNYWLPQSVIDRWAMTENSNGQLDQSAQSREDLWKYALDYFESSPLVGIGFGAFALVNPTHLDTHNIYYRTLAEQGLIGIVVFGMVWFYLFRLGYELWKGGPCRFDRNYGFALMAATFGLLIANYFGDRFLHLPLIGQFWAFAGIGARLRSNMLGLEPLTDAGKSAYEENDGLGQIPVAAGGRPALPARPTQPAYASQAQAPAGWRRVQLALLGRASAEKPVLNVIGAKETRATHVVPTVQQQFERRPPLAPQPAAINVIGRRAPPEPRR